jgi:hypothetical protein
VLLPASTIGVFSFATVASEVALSYSLAKDDRDTDN